MSVDAERLAAAFRGAGPLAALEAPPADIAAGYDLQDAVRALLGDPIVGWKLAVTTAAAQAAAGLDAPTVSPLLKGMIVPSDTVFGSHRFYKPEGEAEIVIELAETIDKAVTPAEVREAMAGLRLAIEIADTRYVDKPAMGPAGVIADMNSCGSLVVGPLEGMSQLDDARAADVFMRLGDGSMVQGLAPGARPDPLGVVAFLSGFVTARGHVLPAGTIITTGTHVPPTRTTPGLLAAEFAGVGRVNCRLSEAWSPRS